MTITIVQYDEDHSDLDSFLDNVVRKAVKANIDKLYRYYPDDSWWDSRVSFVITGALDKQDAYQAITKESEKQGFSLKFKNLY